MSTVLFQFRGVFLALLVVSISTVQSCQAQTSSSASYATKITFKKGVAIHFADFDLTYVGERNVASKIYPHGFLFHDFRAEHGAEKVNVSWSSGTGDIGPTSFTIDRKKHQLELRHSDKLGQLKIDELVVR